MNSFTQKLEDLKAVFGAPGATKRSFKKEYQRTSFEGFLPWEAYDPKTKAFYQSDESVGFVYECLSHFFTAESTARELESIFREFLPNLSVINFSIYADPYIDPIVRDFVNKDVTGIPLLKNAAEELASYFVKCTKGMPQTGGIPLRNYRLIVSIKLPLKEVAKAKLDLGEYCNQFEEKLNTANFCPTVWGPVELLETMRRFFNPDFGVRIRDYDDETFIKHQVIKADTVIVKSKTEIQIGDRYFRCQTVKSPPKTISMVTQNKLLGGIDGPTTDNMQITTPYWLSCSLVVRDYEADFKAKATLLAFQKETDTTGKTLGSQRHEHDEALRRIEENKVTYVATVPIIWYWNDDKDKLNQAGSKIKTLWESQGYQMQSDVGILVPLLLNSFPLGFQSDQQFLTILSRDYPLPADLAVRSVPTQADFMGSGVPTCLLVGRKGQLITLDVFQSGTNNYNGKTIAGSGAGKSFWNNYMVLNHYSKGCKARLVDIGGSYKKLCELVGGKYVDFDENSKICLNPFGGVDNSTPEKLMETIQTVVQTVEEMVRENGQEVKKINKTFIEAAAVWAFEQKGKLAGIDEIQYFLNHVNELFFGTGEVESKSNITPKKKSGGTEQSEIFNLFDGDASEEPLTNEDTQNEETISFDQLNEPLINHLAEEAPEGMDDDDFLKEAEKQDVAEREKLKNQIKSQIKYEPQFQKGVVTICQSMAATLSKFTRGAVYGDYFNGEMNLNIGEDDFVVLELQALAEKKDLMPIVLGLLVSAITKDLYMSDRSRPTLCIFDEAHQFMTDGSFVGKAIALGYRVARKFYGGFWIVTQSPLDFLLFKTIGTAINANCDFNIWMRSPDYEKAKEEKLINHSDFQLELQKGVDSPKGRYSEMLIEIGKNWGIGRLVIDLYNYFIYTSDAKDVAAIEKLVLDLIRSHIFH